MYSITKRNTNYFFDVLFNLTKIINFSTIYEIYEYCSEVKRPKRYHSEPRATTIERKKQKVSIPASFFLSKENNLIH